MGAGGIGVKLLYNDYNILSSGDGHWMKTKSDRVYELLKSMKDRGIPVDGVGVQAHLNTDWDYPDLYSGMRSNLQRYQDLGLEVHITELDIEHNGQWDAAAEAKQAGMYRRLLEICLEFQACKTFSLWGFTDKSTWRGSHTHPLIYTVSYEPKAALQEMIDALVPLPTQEPSPVPTPRPTLAPTPAPSPGRCNSLVWGQCGGEGWAGPFCCESPGLECKVQDETWFHQCVPTGSAPAVRASRLRKVQGISLES